MEEKILEVIDKSIRPYLNSHNGDIQFIGVKDGVVKVRLLGQCSNCALSRDTVKNVIETSLKLKIQQVKKVEVVNYISQETLDLAKKILNKDLDD
jgi:Fe-S cluster biogenesis protein NfuA